MAFLFFILFIAILGAILLYARHLMLRNNMRERLLFGVQDATTDAVEINLSAGDYGLVGSAKFLYFLSQTLSTPAGYLGIFALGAAIGLAVKFLFGFQSFSVVMAIMLGGGVLLMNAVFYLGGQRRKRLRQIKYELPNALQGITAVMESGLAFESALSHLVRESGTAHPLYFDLAVVLEAMQRGRRRNEALRLWATRANEPSVSEVVAGMIQAEQTGASLGSVLKHHANTLLKENEAELLRRAERIPIYMLAPMMLCIMPPIMIVAVGPSAIRIINMFKVIMSNA